MRFSPFHKNDFLLSSRGSIRTTVIGGIIAGMVFAGLMATRLGVFKQEPSPLPQLQISARHQDSWMSIWQSDRKIGYNHRQFATTESGHTISDHTVMRINTMGLVQDIEMRTNAGLHADMSLSAFEMNLASSRFSFSVRGRADDNLLHVSTETARFDIPLDGPVYITAGIWDAAAAAVLEEGDSMNFSIFDPLSMDRHPVRVTFLGRESIRIRETAYDARKYSVSFLGVTETAWIDDTGEVLREEGLLGISLQKDTKERALETASLTGSRDLTLAASVAVGTILDDPERLTRLRLKIEGIPETLFLDGGRQTFSNDVLTIHRESLPDPPTLSIGQAAGFLAPGPFVESDHPDILAAAKTAVGAAERPLEKARKLVSWVHDNLEKRPVLSVPTALETLRQKAGDCNEHAVLLAALSRAAGIPARVEAGLVYMDGRFYYHAWNSLFLNEWVTADAIKNQLPADVTHIRLVKNAAHEQADILGAVGRITIQILDTEQAP